MNHRGELKPDGLRLNVATAHGKNLALPRSPSPTGLRLQVFGACSPAGGSCRPCARCCRRRPVGRRWAKVYPAGDGPRVPDRPEVGANARDLTAWATDRRVVARPGARPSARRSG